MIIVHVYINNGPPDDPTQTSGCRDLQPSNIDAYGRTCRSTLLYSLNTRNFYHRLQEENSVVSYWTNRGAGYCLTTYMQRSLNGVRVSVILFVIKKTALWLDGSKAVFDRYG